MPQVVEIVIDPLLHLLDGFCLTAITIHLSPTGDARLHLVAHHVALDQAPIQFVMRHGMALSEKLNLALFASRDLAPYQSNSTSWYTNDTVGISPTWNLTPRMSLSANLTNNQRKCSGGLYPAPATATRTDRVKMHTLRLNWTPVDYATLTASLGSETRDAPLTGTGYSSHTANLSLTLSF